MSNNELDLNIDNYNLKEIEHLLKVEKPYSLNYVLKNEKMITRLLPPLLPHAPQREQN